MLKRKLTIPEIYLVIINLLPLLGVWFQGWDPARIFLFYCLETILVGVFHVIKMIVLMFLSRPNESPTEKSNGRLLLGSCFIVLFFIMHYGIFIFIQTSMFFAVSGLFKGELFSLNAETLQQLLGNEGMLMMVIFAVYYLLDIFRTMTAFRIEKPSDIIKLMFQPYVRIFIQQIVLIFGSMFLVFRLGYIFIVIFVAVRLYVDLFPGWSNKLNRSIDKAEKENKAGFDKMLK